MKNSVCWYCITDNVQVENTAETNIPEWSLKIALTCYLNKRMLGDVYFYGGLTLVVHPATLLLPLAEQDEGERKMEEFMG